MRYLLEVLFPYIILLYLCDCIAYVKNHHVLLNSWFGNKFSLKLPGLRLAGVLPASQTILTHDLPLYCTPDGIYAVSGQNGASGRIARVEDFHFISFDNLASIEVDGKNISLNDTFKIQTPSAASARFHADFIKKISMLRPSERRQAIKVFLSDSYDLAAIGKIQKSSAKYFWTIKLLSAQLFVLVFLFLPAALYSNLSDFVNFSALSVCTGIIYCLLLAAAFITEKKLARIDAEIKACTLPSIIFSPVNALHVMSYLTRNLYFKFNYLALAAYFMHRDAFKEIIRKEMLLVDFFENKNDRQDWRIFWQLKKELLQDLLVKCEISMGELSTPPEKKDQTAVSYCPLCLSEYSEKRHNCIDCEMSLKEFSA